MRLWSDEIEEMRGEARKVVAESFGERMAALITTGPLPADPLVRAQQRRDMMEALMVPVPSAIEREIAGVGCRVFMPDGPAAAVYLHFHGGGHDRRPARDERYSQREAVPSPRLGGGVG